MAVKLAAYAERAGVAPEPLLAAYELAIERRLAVLRDVFHPDALHPARNILILLEDVACRDSDVLVAAALTESEYDAMRIDAGEVRERFGTRAAALLAEVPLPQLAQDGLAEELVTVDHDVALIAVAERLDHARHLHFREPAAWRPFYEQICEIYLPVAARVHTRLAERLGRWASSFEKRFLA